MKLKEDIADMRVDYRRKLDSISLGHKTEVKDFMKKLTIKEQEIVYVNKQLCKTTRTHAKDISVQTLQDYHTIAAQTETTVKIPYLVTDPLPPIFQKRLLHKTPLLNLFTNSLPDMSKIWWCEFDPSFIHEEEAVSEDVN